MFKRIISLIIAATVVFAFGACAKKDNSADALSVYNIVGTDKWNKMSRAERVSACRIPADTLSKMSSAELVRAVIEYPFFVDILAYDDVKTGYKALRSECGALQELVKREDGAQALLNVYNDASAQPENADSNEIKCLELLLMQDDFAEVMTK